MKKTIACLLALVLLTLSLTAFAAEPEYAMTGDFISVLEANNLMYTFYEKNDNGYERVQVKFNDEDYDVIAYQFFFKPTTKGMNRVEVRVWNLIDFDAANRAKTVEACNTSEYEYLWPKFVVDDSDNSVSVMYDALLPDRGAGNMAYEIMYLLADVLTGAWEYLGPCAK